MRHALSLSRLTLVVSASIVGRSTVRLQIKSLHHKNDKIHIIHRPARAAPRRQESRIIKRSIDQIRSKAEKSGYRITQVRPGHLQKALIRGETVHAEPIPRLLIGGLCPLPVHCVQRPHTTKQHRPTFADALSTHCATPKSLRTLQCVRKERVQTRGAGNEASLIDRLTESPGKPEPSRMCIVHGEGIKNSRKDLGQVALPCECHCV